MNILVIVGLSLIGLMFLSLMYAPGVWLKYFRNCRKRKEEPLSFKEYWRKRQKEGLL